MRQLEEDTVDGDAEDLYCPVCHSMFAGFLQWCPDDGARLVASRDPLVGTVLDGRYRIIGPIGEGAMGRVYLAIQLSVDRAVAIKVIRDPDYDASRRFLREARMLTTLSHPNIVNVYDFGSSDGVMYLVLELLRGRTLAAELARYGRLDVRRACEIAIQLCDALAAAHACGIVHRDLKPANIVLVDGSLGRDLVKVLDFGLAKSVLASRSSANDVTKTGIIVGTPLYLSPEQIGGDTAGPCSDIYALGCVLHEMLAGAPPFDDGSTRGVLFQQLTAPPPRLANVPIEVAELVEAMLAKDPADRPVSAVVVAEQLRAIVAEASELDEALTIPHGTRHIADEATTMPHRLRDPESLPHRPRDALAPTQLLAPALAPTALATPAVPARRLALLPILAAILVVIGVILVLAAR